MKSLLAATFFLTIAFSVAAVVADDTIAEKLPSGSAVISIEARPASIELKHKFDYCQLLITGKLSSGEMVDLTRMARPSQESAAVTVASDGLVRAKADGSDKITYSFEGKSVEVPVAVSGVDAPHAVSFVRDVQPILSRMGCNAGTCHGSKEGKNGFKLSLRGYDPVYDVAALTDENASRRVNVASPDDSLMLLKDTGSVPHVGGQLFKPGEPNYEIIRRWIAGGAKLNPESPRVGQR